MFNVKRRLKSVRDAKKQPHANNKDSDQSVSVSKSNHRGILKLDSSCRVHQSHKSLYIWTTKSSAGSASEEPLPHQFGSQSTGSVDRSRPRRVLFDSVRIREYERTLGDNPSCSSGAPITLGWSHGKESKVNINDYESVRQGRRSQRELALSRIAREDLLLEWGSTFNEIIEAVRSNVKIKSQRRRTVNSIGTYDKWEEAMERAGRRIKKTLLLHKGTGTHRSGKPLSGAQNVRAAGSDSPVSSVSSEAAAENIPLTGVASEGVSQTAIHRIKVDDGNRSESNKDDSQVEQQAPSAVATEMSPDAISPVRPTPLIEIQLAPSCISGMSMMEDEFDEDGFDDFEDLLDPYVTDEGNKMYPPEIHIANSHGDGDTGTLTGSYAGYSMYSTEGFELMTRDHSYWKVEAGSTNSGPKVKRVFDPITIYEDGSAGDPETTLPYYQTVQHWQLTGFQGQSPPHSALMASRLE